VLKTKPTIIKNTDTTTKLILLAFVGVFTNNGEANYCFGLKLQTSPFYTRPQTFIMSLLP
jgi:hypothetical protein